MNEPDEFTNVQVDHDTLPDYRRVSIHPVTPAFVPYAVISACGFWLVVVAVAAGIHWLPLTPWDAGRWPLLAMTFGMVLMLWFGLIAWLDARRRGWALREHDLVYRYGVIWRKTVILPFARIQHVETTSGPLERWLGLMRVKCFTAGGVSSDLTVEGLDIAAARKVRQYLLEQIQDDQPDDSGDAPEARLSGSIDDEEPEHVDEARDDRSD